MYAPGMVGLESHGRQESVGARPALGRVAPVQQYTGAAPWRAVGRGIMDGDGPGRKVGGKVNRPEQ